jgi:hypothetical protein
MNGEWIWSCRPKKRVNALKVGKWLIFCSPQQVDRLWATIVTSMDGGALSKVSIGCKVNTAGRDPNKHVICVYTANYLNKDGVAACLSALRELGIEGVLSYKTDNQTRAKQYASRGIKASTYSSSDFEGSKHSYQIGMF